MTQETMTDLRKYVLTGFDKPWHFDPANPDSVANFYELGVPPEQVEALFALATAVKSPVFVFDENGKAYEAEGWTAITQPGMGRNVPYVGKSFEPHQFNDDLWAVIKEAINGELRVASAGLLKQGAQAFVQISRPEPLEASGLEFRPGLMGATALDGTMKTGWFDTSVHTVCDNTCTWAISSARASVRVKHTRNSVERIHKGDVLEALQSMAENMGHEINRAADTNVTDSQFEQFLTALFPDPKDPETETRAKAQADRKRGEMRNMYHTDPRAKPWAGNVLGVMQAANTWFNHESPIRGADRIERQKENTINGKLEAFDALAFKTIRQLVAA